ncbi:desumoylating isopeptidase 1-like protein [Tanacetum coccineum]
MFFIYLSPLDLSLTAIPHTPNSIPTTTGANNSDHLSDSITTTGRSCTLKGSNFRAERNFQQEDLTFMYRKKITRFDFKILRTSLYIESLELCMGGDSLLYLTVVIHVPECDQVYQPSERDSTCKCASWNIKRETSKPVDPLRDARSKVQKEIRKEFVAMMTSGTILAIEAAAVATKKVMQKFGHTNAVQS